MPTPVPAGASRHTGGCLQPVLLRGRADYIDGGTGELIHRYTTVHEPGGVLPVACKTRRASRCPPCAEVYRVDTYQLIRAGLSGGKGIPATVTDHPCVFVTLTAPSFGPVHAKRPRAQAQEPGTVWTVAQLRAFLAAARQHRLFAFFHVAAYTGSRRGELLNLRWQDTDLDGKKITITGSTAVIGGERVTGTTKSGRARVVPIDDETVTVLWQRKADQAAEQLKAGDSWRGTSYRTRDYMTSGTCTRQPCCSQASPSTSSQPGSATRIPQSHFAFTPT